MIGRVFLAPFDVILPFGSCILIDKASDDFLGFVELVETVLEDSGAFEVLHESTFVCQFLILVQELLKKSANTRMIGKHHSADLVRRLDVGTTLRQGNLDGSGTPGGEVGKLSLAYTLQRLVNLRGINLALYDVKD